MYWTMACVKKNTSEKKKWKTVYILSGLAKSKRVFPQHKKIKGKTWVKKNYKADPVFIKIVRDLRIIHHRAILFPMRHWLIGDCHLLIKINFLISGSFLLYFFVLFPSLPHFFLLFPLHKYWVKNFLSEFCSSWEGDLKRLDSRDKIQWH